MKDIIKRIYFKDGWDLNNYILKNNLKDCFWDYSFKYGYFIEL